MKDIYIYILFFFADSHLPRRPFLTLCVGKHFNMASEAWSAMGSCTATATQCNARTFFCEARVVDVAPAMILCQDFIEIESEAVDERPASFVPRTYFFWFEVNSTPCFACINARFLGFVAHISSLFDLALEIVTFNVNNCGCALASIPTSCWLHDMITVYNVYITFPMSLGILLVTWMWSLDVVGSQGMPLWRSTLPGRASFNLVRLWRTETGNENLLPEVRELGFHVVWSCVKRWF